MPRFLSTEWIAAVGAIAATAQLDRDLPGSDLVLQQEVTGAPDGTVCYRLRIGPGGISAEANGEGQADITMVTDYPTAVAIARGRLTAHEAARLGHLDARGALDRIADIAPALARLAESLGPLREDTDW